MNKLHDNFPTRLFLSYSWNNAELANTIDNELTALGFEVKRDIRDIGPWTSIKDFMSSICNQDYAIMIISPSYLKSANCMYEVIELLKDSQYKDKILSIVTADANIYNPISRAEYIKYWEEETKKLEDAIIPLKLENIAELTLELRKYKSIGSTIASFLDLISDKNNPNVTDAVEKIKERVLSNGLTSPKSSNQNNTNNLKINIDACHFAFLKFAALSDLSGTGLEKKIGIKKLSKDRKQDEYDLPMLRCEVLNCSKHERTIQEPMIKGVMEINGMSIDGIGFTIIPETQKRLEPGAKATFTLQGPVLINIIKAFYENKIESIYVEDNFGFCYYVVKKQLEEVTEYFRKYCSDLVELQEKYNKYFI